MMRLPSFRVPRAANVDEAAALARRAARRTMLLAGGTDLLPNMKRRQQTPRTLDRPAPDLRRSRDDRATAAA